jgi:hypothetical protein
VSGSLTVSVDMGGQKHTMKNEWTGRRIGVCQ